MLNRRRCRGNRLLPLALLVVILLLITFASARAYVLPPQPDPNVPGEGDGDDEYLKDLPPIKLQPGTGSHIGSGPITAPPEVRERPGESVRVRDSRLQDTRGRFQQVWTGFWTWWQIVFHTMI